MGSEMCIRDRVQCSRDLSNCAGIVLDLDGIPPMDDAEIEAILVSLTSKMSADSLVLLRDVSDRVDHLFRLVVDLDLDGAVIDAASPGGSRAASALPRIGLAARAMNLTGQGRQLMIEIDEPPAAEDLLICVAAGCSVLVAPPPKDGLEEALQWLRSTTRGWMIELGIDGFRFDLGIALSRGEDLIPLETPPLFEEIEADPYLSDLKLISEPWDCGGLYRLSDFPATRISTWNGH